jgi:NAD(P)-dependent dehydrogenase (short-subunit alcohol dehydrogenase family)
MPVMQRFSGKTVVLTGSASGIGRETALAFAREGAHVVGADLNVRAGEEVADLCGKVTGSADFVETNVTREADIARLIDHAVQTRGQVDVLFNNAGSGGAYGPVEEVASDDWDHTVNLLLRSVFYGTKHAVPHMKRAGRGAIVSTSSVAGIRGFRYGHAYSAAKAGVINLTRSTAIELGPYGIRANCVCPGDILTPMQGGGDPAAIEASLNEKQPIRRAGQSADVAGAVLFLASDEAGWVTGESITIDGGFTVGIWSYDQTVEPDAVPKAMFLGPTFLNNPTR